VRVSEGLDCRVIVLAVGDQGADADDRMINVLRKLVSDSLADLFVGLPGQPVRGAKPRRSGTVSRSQTMTLPFMA
jgi:hypothetical protein